jgi:DNA polymerase III subunit delta'
VAADDIDEPDCFPGTPHPRERMEFFGHRDAERVFLEAYKSGQLHHAWLIGGPEGVGKATFAYRAARFLLANPDPGLSAAGRADSLAVPAAHPAARKLAALSHPDFAVVRRALRKDGKGYSAEISVDVVRRALELFHTTAGDGGYRVCIVDAGDELNESSANALLKMLEEPPRRSVFFVVAHRPALLLPTIRSRCRFLPFRPLDAHDVEKVVHSLGEPWSDTDSASLARATALSRGSIHRALLLLDEDTLALVERVNQMLERLPALDVPALVALAESVAGRGREADLDVAMGVVFDWVATRVEAEAGQGAGRLASLVEVWEKCARAAREAEDYNLDRRPLVISMFGELADAMRRARAA